MKTKTITIGVNTWFLYGLIEKVLLGEKQAIDTDNLDIDDLDDYYDGRLFAEENFPDLSGLVNHLRQGEET